MNKTRFSSLIIAVALTTLIVIPTATNAKEIVRPEEVRSMRKVVYDSEDYQKLAELWKDYYNEYPSEYAYANWMYAARYARSENYETLLDKGVEQYPANPTLLYLKEMVHHGKSDDAEGRRYLERAIALAPNYVDPWYSLITHYMDGREDEQLDRALRKILESGDITDEVMDYNYNVLLGLEEDAILITNGDNDTYPAWILTRILKIRPDVRIVNRSLLNSAWYPLYVIEQGLPRFIGKDELHKMREDCFQSEDWGTTARTPGGPFGDTLIERIVESAERAGRPVYLAKTVYITEKLKALSEEGREVGLAVLVTSSDLEYADQVKAVFSIWTSDFRTGGLDSWRLHNASAADAGRSIVNNYATVMATNLETLKKVAPELLTELFDWYKTHLEELLNEEMKYRFAYGWCAFAQDIKEVCAWCKDQGMECSGQ